MNITNKLMVIAVSAVSLGTMAYGATETATAQIPFAFHTAGTTLPAGSYQVTRDFAGIRGMIQMRNTESQKGAIVMGLASDAPGTNLTVLRFACDDGCELVGVRGRNSLVTIQSHWKPRRATATAIIEIPVAVAAGN
jgi:hypothetical protein